MQTSPARDRAIMRELVNAQAALEQAQRSLRLAQQAIVHLQGAKLGMINADSANLDINQARNFLESAAELITHD